MHLILLCTLAALSGLPIGYGIGWALDEADRLFDAYMDGMGWAAMCWLAEVRR